MGISNKVDVFWRLRNWMRETHGTRSLWRLKVWACHLRGPWEGKRPSVSLEDGLDLEEWGSKATYVNYLYVISHEIYGRGIEMEAKQMKEVVFQCRCLKLFCIAWDDGFMHLLPLQASSLQKQRCTLRNFPHLPDHCIEWVQPACCWLPFESQEERRKVWLWQSYSYHQLQSLKRF